MEENKILTKEQKMAQAAWARVEKRSGAGNFGEYNSFALVFPALIHSCGLVQAVAFAVTKDREKDFLEDLKAVFNMIDHTDDLAKQSREAGLAEYTRISRHALAAASWIKRYCQALDKDAKGGMNLAELPQGIR